MYTRRFIATSLVGIWLWSISPLCAQSLPVPEVISPQNQQVYAWGRAEPGVRIEVRAAPSSPTIQHFVTANIFTTAGRLVERVSLHDDGSHTDAVAGDGVFTNIYTLREKGEFQIRVRLQQTDVASGISREKWSEPVVFSVEQVPYVDITSPNHHAKVASIANVSAALLVGSQQQLYRPADDEVRIRCWIEPEAKAIVPERPSDTFSALVEFPRPGKYRLFMAAQTLRNGQWIESEPDSVWVNVVRPPMWPFGIAILSFLIALLLPAKQLWLYRHMLEIRTRDGRTETVEVRPNRLKDVVITVGGEGCDKRIPGVPNKLFTLTAKPGEQLLHVQVEGKAGVSEVRPHPSIVAFSAGNLPVYYRECKPVGKMGFPNWSFNTVPKRVLFFLTIITLLYGVWRYWQFVQMIPSS